MNTRVILIVTLFVFGASSCKKQTADSQETLTSKSWKRALNDLNPSTNPQGPVLYYAVRNCEKDDTFTFGSSGKLVIDRSNDKCDPNESQTENQSYTLNRQTKALVINGTTFTLAEESNTQIKYYAVVPMPGGFQYLVFLLQ